MLPAQSTSTSSLYHSHEERKQCTKKHQTPCNKRSHDAYAAAVLSDKKEIRDKQYTIQNYSMVYAIEPNREQRAELVKRS